MRFPESKDGVVGTDETVLRMRFGSWLHSKFIIGTLLNILISALGAWSYFRIADWLAAG